jgi:hypothetical protein
MEELIHKYGEFESILPEELKLIDFNNLKSLQDEFKTISN